MCVWLRLWYITLTWGAAQCSSVSLPQHFQTCGGRSCWHVSVVHTELDGANLVADWVTAAEGQAETVCDLGLTMRCQVMLWQRNVDWVKAFDVSIVMRLLFGIKALLLPANLPVLWSHAVQKYESSKYPHSFFPADNSYVTIRWHCWQCSITSLICQTKHIYMRGVWS